MATQKRNQKSKGQKEIDAVVKTLIDPIRKELELAYKRINGNSIRRLRWLLEFSEANLDSLSQGKQADIGWEVAMFSANLRPDKLHEDFTILGDFDLMMMDPNTYEKIHQVHPDLIRWFQKTMKAVFDLLYAGKPWHYRYPAKVRSIAASHLTPPGEPMYADNWEGMTPQEKLELRAFELLQEEKSRLMICANPNCKRRFVATKQGRTRFHSPTCSAYVRIAKSRGKKL